jgi:serine protease Do
VVGINTAILSPAGGNVGIGFAIPAKLARWVIDHLRANGKVVRGWLGVAVQPVTPALARAFDLGRVRGALVSEVTDGSPAAEAGVRRGDVIVRFGDRTIESSRELPTQVAEIKPGTTVPVTVLREGKERTFQVKIEQMPGEERETRAADDERGVWGLAVAPLGEEEARRRGLPALAGVVVADVRPGSPADDADLRRGDLILEVDRQPVRSPEELQRSLRGKDDVLLLVRRGEQAFFVGMSR